MNNDCPYRPTLRALVAAGVPFCLIGTYALREQLPELAAAYPLTDCDVLLPPDMETLSRAIAVLQHKGWKLTLWDEPLPVPLTAAAVAGKYYVRARRSEAVLDLTYELEENNWADFEVRCHWIDGLPLVEPAFLLALKARRNQPTDQLVVQLCQALKAADTANSQQGCSSAEGGLHR